MSMLLIVKELAEAVISSHVSESGARCEHCITESWFDKDGVLQHSPSCIVTRAKLLLEQEWGIES